MFRQLRKWVVGLFTAKVNSYYLSGTSLMPMNDAYQEEMHPISSRELSFEDDGGDSESSNRSEYKLKKDARISKKPVEVVQEIMNSEKPVLNLENLDEKIKIVKKRFKVLKEHGITGRDEIQALSYLEARKKYKKFEVRFNWATTTGALIDKLTSTYKLKTSSLAPNYKNIPGEAIDEIEKFTEVFKKVSKHKINFKLIMDEGGKETKKDPILLAASPFGNYWYILGAWDKEVEIVDDLIYKGK